MKDCKFHPYHLIKYCGGGFNQPSDDVFSESVTHRVFSENGVEGKRRIVSLG
jgi:hypothetical protein